MFGIPNFLAILLPLFVLAWQPACQPRAPRGTQQPLFMDTWPDRRSLARSMRAHERILLVYGTGKADSAAAFRRLAEAWARQADDQRLELRPDTSLDLADFRRHPALLVGSPRANRWCDSLATYLGLHIGSRQVAIGGHRISGKDPVLTLAPYPSPAKQDVPIMMVTGTSDRAVWSTLRTIGPGHRWLRGWSPWGLSVFQEAQRVAVAAFDDRNGWSLDTSSLRLFPSAPVASERAGPFVVHRYPKVAPGPELAAYPAKLVERLQDMEAFCGKRWNGPTVHVNLYPSIEEKGMMVQETRPEQVHFSRLTLDKVWNDTYAQQDGFGMPRLLLRHLLGQPSSLALEIGLAAHFTERWQFRGYSYWARRLQQSGNLPSLQRLLDNETLQKGSPLVYGAAAGAFTDFLLDHWGRDLFLERYLRWTPSPTDLEDLDGAWQAWLRDQPSAGPSRPRPHPLPYLKGFNFAHEGYAIYNGYGSRLAVESLTKLSGLGANAVAIIPYAGMRDPHRPQPISLQHSAGSENDESLVHANHAAQQLGQFTMMKPQLWMGRGYWPGDIAMKNEADWQRFFGHYHDWMLHYALLAEIYGFDLLCVGTELSRTTLAREADWRNLIRRLRGVFSGPITYAANWGEEFEQLPFWDALDFMGLNCYYPLSDDPNAGRASLRRGFNRNLQRVRRVVDAHDRPLLLTEIGFTSAQNPWIEPHRDGRDRPNQPEHQAMCYEVAFEALAQWSDCVGMFWWKFPSYPSYTGRRDGICFTPNEKPAAEVVSTWFGRLGHRPAK